MKYYIRALFLVATTALWAQEIEVETEKWKGNRPDGHAPISVMGDHTHGKGEFMFSYRYMFMNMEDLNRNSNNASFDNALSEYMVTPTSMPMNMHMLGVMHAPSNKITLMAMVNYISLEMDHITRMGGVFTTNSSGFGDTKIGALYKFFNKKRQQLHGEIGLSIPTGSINEKDINPTSMGNEVILPYPMQIGSGTFDFGVALTYLRQWNNTSFGSQIKSTIRSGKNDNEYRLGNRYSFNNWFAIKAANWISLSGRIELGAIDKIEGANTALNPMMVITADTANSGMTYANAGIGFNAYVFQGNLKDLRLGFEASLPLFQNMNGIQLKTKETLIFGLQYAL